MDENKTPSADPTQDAPPAPPATEEEDANVNWKEDAGALSEAEADRIDAVMVNVSAPARNALKRNGYTLERVAMTNDRDLAAIKGVTEDAVRAMRQRVPYRDGSDS